MPPTFLFCVYLQLYTFIFCEYNYTLIPNAIIVPNFICVINEIIFYDFFILKHHIFIQHKKAHAPASSHKYMDLYIHTDI